MYRCDFCKVFLKGRGVRGRLLVLHALEVRYAQSPSVATEARR